MNRLLPAHFPGATDIPRFQRVRFYRNKANEHWDAYTVNIANNGFMFQHGKAAIPSVDRVIIQTERISLLAELRRAFTTLGVNFVWPDEKAYYGVSTDPEYSEAVFTALESVSAGLSTPSGKSAELDRVIILLLEFGFPTPISDLEAYSADLIAHLRTHT